MDELTRLERANAELEAANRELARGLMGKQDAAAAVTAAKLSRLEEENARLRVEVERLQTEVALERAWRSQPRYRAVDRVRTLLRRLPVIGHLWRLLGRLAS